MSELPLSLQDVHHQLRAHPELLEQLAEIYDVQAADLQLIADEPAERIEVWERTHDVSALSAQAKIALFLRPDIAEDEEA